MDMGFSSCRKNAFFRGAHQIGAAISGPRIADKNFMDTRIFLSLGTPNDHLDGIYEMTFPEGQGSCNKADAKRSR